MDKQYKVTRLKNTEAIRLAVEKNGGFCPCKVVKDDTTRCLCLEFREAGPGECSCGLYEKKPIEYILYTKAGCPRCDILKKKLRDARKLFIESTDYPKGSLNLPILYNVVTEETHLFKQAMELSFN